MTSACDNCGAAVSDNYVRVFSPDGEGVECCPRCPDMCRVDGVARPAQNGRHTARAVRSDGGGR